MVLPIKNPPPPRIDYDELQARRPGDNDELQALGQDVGRWIMQTIGDWQTNTARSQQSTSRVLGMSELGGCREYIRASIAGDEKKFPNELKWAAFVGTAVGDVAEHAIAERESRVQTQRDVTVTLPSGIQVGGHTDAILGPNLFIDFKTKDGTEEVSLAPNGPDYKEKVQISGYFVGLVEEGVLTKDASAHLVYLDRSGRDSRSWVYSIDYPTAVGWLASADERLEDVAKALTTGEVAGHLRDMPESWCYNTGCPFYEACWGEEEYNPTAPLGTTYDEALRMYDEGRKLVKQGDNLQRAAKAQLNPEPGNDDKLVVGRGSEFQIKWTLRPTGQQQIMRPAIDVRALPKGKA